MAAPQYTQTHTPLSLTTGVTINIQAPPEVVWRILTDAKGFSTWNSTVSAIEGEIREGSQIRIHVPGTKRTFGPTVSDVVANKGMTWSSGAAGVFRGVRVFGLQALPDGSTTFAMQEQFSGVMFALTKGSMPDFKPIFERYATDLREEAERIARAAEPQRPSATEPLVTPV